jgi:hypothetical protein
VRGRERGAFRAAAREAARRAGCTGGVDAADLILRAGRAARRVAPPVLEETRSVAAAVDELPASGADSSAAAALAESAEV